jgi:hypothetical protein
MTPTRVIKNQALASNEFLQENPALPKSSKKLPPLDSP